MEAVSTVPSLMYQVLGTYQVYFFLSDVITFIFQVKSTLGRYLRFPCQRLCDQAVAVTTQVFFPSIIIVRTPRYLSSCLPGSYFPPIGKVHSAFPLLVHVHRCLPCPSCRTAAVGDGKSQEKSVPGIHTTAVIPSVPGIQHSSSNTKCTR